MNMKKINLIVPILLPENIACKNRMESFIEVLSKRYQINLITLSKTDEEHKVKNLFKKYDLKYYFIFNDKYHKDYFYKRALKEIVFSYKLIKLSKTVEADFIIATSPSMFIIPFLQFDKRRKILDLRDLVWEYIGNKKIKNTLNVIMRFSLNKINKLIVTNQYERKVLENYRPEIIYNGISEDKFNKLSNIEFEKNDKFSITYVGNIGIAQNVGILIKAAQKLTDINFNIVGDGVEFEKINEYVKKHKLQNVLLYGRKEWNEILDIYKKSNVLWAQLDENFKSAVPSKLYEYLSTGLPVIFGGYGEAVNLLKNFENCFIHKPGDVDGLSKILLNIKEKNFSKSSYNIRKIRENYIREKQALKLLEILEDL